MSIPDKDIFLSINHDQLLLITELCRLAKNGASANIDSYIASNNLNTTAEEVYTILSECCSKYEFLKVANLQRD